MIREKPFDVSAQDVALKTLITHKLPIRRIGSSNFYRLYPLAVKEGFFDESEVIYSLSAPQNEIIQVFRAQDDNIGMIGLVLNSEGLHQVIDDFESYVDEASLDAAWVQSDPINTPANLETNTVAEGTQSMSIKVTRWRSYGDRVTYTFATPQDWSGYDELHFHWRSTRANMLRLVIEDVAGSGLYINLPDTDGEWQQQIIPFNQMRVLGANFPDMSQISKIYFEVINDSRTRTFYVDSLEVRALSGSSVDFQIIDLGDTLPTSVAPPFVAVPFDDGTQFKTIVADNHLPLERRIDYIDGLAIGLFDLSNRLKKGRYYGIRLFNMKGTFPVVLWGGNRPPDPTQSFPVFTSADGATFTELTGKTLFFYTGVNFSEGMWLRKVILTPDDITASKVSLRCFDQYGELRVELLQGAFPTDGSEIKLHLERPLLLPRGAYGMVQIDDDGRGVAWKITCELAYHKFNIIEG